MRPACPWQALAAPGAAMSVGPVRASLILSAFPSTWSPSLATPNYSYEKRQRELAKKRKAEEKRQRKLTRPDGAPEDSADSDTDAPTPGETGAANASGSGAPPANPGP